MSYLNKLKKSAEAMDRLAKEVAKINQPKNESFAEDTRYWKPELDKAGNGYAVIRFLPGPEIDGENPLPFARYFSHGIKGPSGKWYVEMSLTTLDKQDPVSELNSKLWKTDNEICKKIAQRQKRKLSYVSNILVISDPKNPENEGKVFLYRYGKKIFDKINDSMYPQFPDKEKVNPFDFWKGANFKLKIRTVSGYVNYELCEFDVPSAVANGDETKLEAILNQEYSLKEIVDPKNFKSYDVLKSKLNEVLGCDTGSDEAVLILKNRETNPLDKASSGTVSTKITKNASTEMLDDDEDIEAANFFKNLLEED